MRLPQPLIESPLFLFSSVEEFASALSRSPALARIENIKALTERGLPPVTSVEVLATMIGINPGIVWSFLYRPEKHYRVYELPKGKKTRTIASPRVGLKIIQTWVGYHLSRACVLPPHVFGFVPGKSHIDAAFEHRGAEWAYSIDITNFFGTTPGSRVAIALERLGYDAEAASIVTRLSTLYGYLTQGSPMSPVLSNLAFLEMDGRLSSIASQFDARLTRYADDIVFSGAGELPSSLPESVKMVFADSPWSLALEKERIEPLKGRIKVHGLIVNGDKVRLTKGYRNKIRAFRHILSTYEEVRNVNSLRGHVNYSDHVSNKLDELIASPPEKVEFEYPFLRDSRIAPTVPNVHYSPLRKLINRLAHAFD